MSSTSHTATEDHRIKLENCLLPIPFVCDGPYENGPGFPPVSLDELRLVNAFNAVVDKEGFAAKLSNDAVRSKWHQEFIDQGLPDDHIAYLFAWLDDTAAIGSLAAGPIGVFASDTIVDAALRSKLTQQVSSLEASQASHPDWHPGSNEQVLDHVHPSLFPLVAGAQMPKLPAIQPFNFVDNTWGGYSVMKRMPEEQFVSKKYQWLPSDFHVDSAGHVTITSDINNLQPRSKHTELYTTIAQVFQKCLPLLESTLGCASLLYQRPHILDVTEYPWLPKEDDDDEDEDEDENMSVKMLRFIHPKLNQPYVPLLQRTSELKKNVFVMDRSQVVSTDLRDRNLQVIVKLATIHLTPDKPSYDGGVWHVEGMANERIIASAIYYFDQENISETRLSFRRAVTGPPYDQGDYDGISLLYGLANEEALVQPNGYVTCRSGRAIAFPNALQHQV